MIENHIYPSPARNVGTGEYKLPSIFFFLRICAWKEHECPKLNRKWKMIVDQASVIISNRITELVDQWQRENNILAAIDREIIHAFSNEFGLLENQVHEIECKYDAVGFSSQLNTLQMLGFVLCSL